MSQENIDFVECKVCGFKGQTLNSHLAKHGMTAEEYHQKFPGVRIACELMMKRQGESVSRAWQQKPKVEKPKTEYSCPYCGGKFNYACNLQLHLKKETIIFINGKEGEDFVVCKICGLRAESLESHLRMSHQMSMVAYQQSHGGKTISDRTKRTLKASNIGKHSKPISERRRSQQCKICGDWYVFGGQERHLRECLVAHTDAYMEGRDYIKCPECRDVFLRLGPHLKDAHGWDKDKLALEVGHGLKLMAQSLSDKMRDSQDFKAIQEKREQTHLERHGYKNPFSDPAVQEKIVETSQRRYGTDHPMQNEEVRIRQNESAMNGPSGQEIFFDEHTCDSVIYTGYGGRYIRCKVPVRKCGRELFNLNPDFMVLPDNVLESAQAASDERRPLDRKKHRTRWVIELLGNWYHSEAVVGVPAIEHEKEMVDAYKSAGIECLVLWERDVKDRWNEIEPMVSAWIQKAVLDINSNPIWRKATKPKVDGRLATLPCPFGSGKVFKSQAKLDKWVASPLNFWHPDMVEGRDYVRCLECPNVRVGKVAEHLRRAHPEMTKEQYLEKHPGALLVAKRVSDMVVSHAVGRVGQKYEARVAYRCPDGSFVRKRDAWIRAWKTEAPPGDSVVSAEVANLDPWAGKVDGVDYVVCRCGYKAANLTQHLRRQHGGLDGHNGPVKSQSCVKALQEAAKKTWDTRGKKLAIENPQTHKRHGLTRELLEQLYVVDGLSDAKIGERYGMTGEGIAYQRKKFGIATKLAEHRQVVVPSGMTTIPVFAMKSGIALRTMSEWVKESGLREVGSEKGIPYYGELDLQAIWDKRRKPEDALFSTEVAKRQGMDIRRFRYWAEKLGLVAKGEQGGVDWYDLSDVLEFEKNLLSEGTNAGEPCQENLAESR